MRPRPAESRSLILQSSISSLAKTRTALVFISWVRGTEERVPHPVAQWPRHRSSKVSCTPSLLTLCSRAPNSQTFHPHHPLYSQALIISGLTFSSSSSCLQAHPSISALRVNPHRPGWTTGERGKNNELLARQVAQGSIFLFLAQ